MPDSYITANADGKVTGYIGKDATQLFRVRTLRSSIELHKKTGLIPTRGVTITRMFDMASQYTGKKYKRGAHDQAAADLGKWIAEMTSALPVVVEK